MSGSSINGDFQGQALTARVKHVRVKHKFRMKLLPNGVDGEGENDEERIWVLLGGEIRMQKTKRQVAELRNRNIHVEIEKSEDTRSKRGHSESTRITGSAARSRHARNRSSEHTGISARRQSRQHLPETGTRPARTSQGAKTGAKKTGGYVFTEADARKGGQKGGLARKQALTKAQRRAIAQKAARARWNQKSTGR